MSCTCIVRVWHDGANMQDEESNPIKQDTKKGKLRFYPYNINWNYGFLPQTWEDPAHTNAECGGVGGDNDPVDVVEISSTQLKMGGVYSVKCVGTYAMIDDGELDWKVIAINTADPLADKINDVEDVERCPPSCTHAFMCLPSLPHTSPSFRWHHQILHHSTPYDLHVGWPSGSSTGCRQLAASECPRTACEQTLLIPRCGCREMPGELEKVMIWFRDYKTPDGKPQNGYGYESKCMNAEFTEGVITETHGLWSKLKKGETKNEGELALV
jgi:inorganic pyrophosphatase